MAGLDAVITGRRAGVPAEQVGARAVAFDAASPLAVAFDVVSSSTVAFDVVSPSTVDVVSVDLPSTVDVSVDNARGAVGGVGLRSGWSANHEVNVPAAVLVAAALPPRPADRARVVTIGSTAGRRVVEAAVGRGRPNSRSDRAAGRHGRRRVAGPRRGRGVFGDRMTDRRRETPVDQTPDGRPGPRRRWASSPRRRSGTPPAG